MLAKVKKIISTCDMLSLGDGVLVGLSGGPDSVCLLCVLKKLQSEYNLKLFTAHLNHGLRGRESDSDEKFCKALAEKLDVPFFSRKVKIVKKKGSMEDSARNARYDFFREIAEETGAKKIALGHNADDQAETVLMRILRGTGVRGLSGIPPVRSFAKLQKLNISYLVRNVQLLIVRPLISVSKKEILNYLKNRGIAYRIDSSNLKMDFFRNRIRHELIPYLRRYNRNVKNVLKNMAVNMALLGVYLDEVVEKEFVRCSRHRLEHLSLSDLSRRPLFLRKELIRKAALEFDPNLNLSADKVDDVLGLISNARGTRSLCIGNGVKVVREYDRLIFSAQGVRCNGYREKLDVPGKIEIPQYGIFVSSVVSNKKFIQRKLFEVEMDYDRLLCPLVVRSRRNGDIFQPIGFNGRKKVKDIFVDAKVPERYRDIAPLVVSGDEICWIPGYRIGEKFKVAPDTKRVLRIKVKGVDNLWQTQVQK